jgi:hypothetical protein
VPHPGLAFVEAWAALIHSLGRSQAQLGLDESLAAALAQREAASGDQPLRVVFSRGEVRVAGRTHALQPGSRARRLAERLEACGVAGALFEPGLRAPSLLAFSRQVLEGAQRSAHDPEFEHWSGEPVEHVHVLQRRFEGVFDGALAETGRRPRSLLRRVVESLPGDALEDPHSASESVLELVREGATTDDSDDDLAELEVELAGLSVDASPERALEPLEQPTELLGVYLHLLTTLELDREAQLLHAPLARRMREAGASGRPLLERHLAPLRDPSPGPEGERARRRLTGFLRDFDLMRVLADHGAFSAELAAERFPEDFDLWLEGLDLARAEDHAQVCALLEQVGSPRVLRAGPLLFAEARLADPARAALLLSRPHAALVPVARLLLARGVPALALLVARFVRALAPSVPEACLLELLDDTELPGDVLAGLLDPPRTPAALAALRVRAAACLCELVERPGADLARRLAAARALAGHDDPAARARIASLLAGGALGRLERDGEALAQALRDALGGSA